MCALFYSDPVLDPSKKAGAVLDSVLHDTDGEVLASKEAETSVAQALRQEPLVQNATARVKSRVLFITRDTGVLTKDSLTQAHFISIAEVFAEVHVLVLADRLTARKGVARLGQNVWAYTTSARYFWTQPFAALDVAKKQLCFADGFRPDIVVALDPFESGLAGLWIAEKFDREFQVHVLEDYYTDEFRVKDKHNGMRVRLASYVLKRTESIRTATNNLLLKVQKKVTHTQDVQVLPRHYDIAHLMAQSAKQTTEDLFPQFAFVILYIGALSHESTLFRALDAARSILFSKSIGMIVLGDGPAKKEFQTRATLLGIQEQVLFRSDYERLPLYMQAADILLCTDTDEAGDETVIKAAASGLPVLVSKTPLRSDLFTDGIDAFLCDREDTVGFSQKLTKFLNTNALRIEFATNAKTIVETRLHEDPQMYKIAYRDSIEGIFEHA